MMTFQEALEAQLKEFDRACLELRELHADPKVLNATCREMDERVARFQSASARIFRLKNVQNEAENLTA